MRLIQTKDYLLLVDKKAEISKAGTLIYENDTNLINITGVDYEPQELDSKIIAYYPLSKEAKELDLPLLPSFKIDVDELAEVSSEKHHYAFGHQSTMYQLGFLEGYKAKAAQSKQFSLEDMYRIAIEVSNRVSRPEYGETININEIVDTYIQSLSTQQLPKEFTPEYEYQNRDTSQWGVYYPFASSASNVRLKTITNSEGKEELVGTYKY